MTTEQDMISNWETFKQQASKIKSSPDISTFLELLEEDTTDECYNVILAPASSKTEFAGSYPGGLIEVSLRTLSYMAKLRTLYDLKGSIADNDLLTVGLFYDIGKLGTTNKLISKKVRALRVWNHYYIPNDSEWHRDHLGQNYKVNKQLEFINPQDLTLYTLASNNIFISLDAHYAISSFRQDKVTDTLYPKENEPPLAALLRQAVWAACKDAKKENYIKKVL